MPTGPFNTGEHAPPSCRSCAKALALATILGAFEAGLSADCLGGVREAAYAARAAADDRIEGWESRGASTAAACCIPEGGVAGAGSVRGAAETTSASDEDCIAGCIASDVEEDVGSVAGVVAHVAGLAGLDNDLDVDRLSRDTPDAFVERVDFTAETADASCG